MKLYRSNRFLLLLLIVLLGVTGRSVYATEIPFRQRIELAITCDLPVQTISGTEVIRLVNTTRAALDTLTIFLPPNLFRSNRSSYFHRYENTLREQARLDLHAVRVDQQPVLFSPADAALVRILLNQPFRPSDSLTLEITFSLHVPRGRCPYCPAVDQAVATLRYFYPLFIPPELTAIAASTPLQLIDDALPGAFYMLTVRLPKPLAAVANLEPAATTVEDNGIQEIRYHSTALNSLTVVIGKRFRQSTFRSHGVTVSLFNAREGITSAQLARIQQTIHSLLAVYARHLHPLPVSRITIVTYPGSAWFRNGHFIVLGREGWRSLLSPTSPGLNHFAILLADDLIYRDTPHPSPRSWFLTGITHHLVSQYTRQYAPAPLKLGLSRARFRFTSESITNLMALAMTRQKIGDPFPDPGEYGSDTPFARPLEAYRSEQIIRMLSGTLGDSLFWELTNHWLTTPAGLKTPQTYNELIQSTVETDLSPFFTYWSDSRTLPDITIARVKRRPIGHPADYYRTEVIVQGIPYSPLPLVLQAVTASADTIKLRKTHFSADSDTFLISSLQPVRRIELDPNRHLWEYNRLNNHYPQKVFFGFLFDLPQIDAYQVFYYPTIELNKSDYARIGVKLRGRYWIHMRPFFPTISHDEWFAGINYGVKSRTYGYDLSYSTSIQALNQPRINLRLRDYFGLTEAQLQSDFYIGQIRYRMLNSLLGYKKLSLGLRYENVYTLRFLSSNHWEEGLTLAPWFSFTNFHNWGDLRHIIRLDAQLGLPALETPFRYSKISLEGQIKWRLTQRLWIYNRAFTGISSGRLPRQQYYYFFGKNIFENLIFENYHLVKGAGDMRGYGEQGYHDRNILTGNNEIRFMLAGASESVFDLIFFFDAGIIQPSMSWKALNTFKHDAGLGFELNLFETIMLGIHFPLWVSEPLPDDQQWAFRWIVASRFNF